MLSIAPSAVTRKVLQKEEVWGDEAFHHLAVVWTENSQIYIAEHPGREPSFDDSDIDKIEGILIPKEHIYPAWRESITEGQRPLPLDTYIKTSQGFSGYSGTSSMVDLVNAEVDIMEVLLKKSHPNICKYYGCIRDGDYIAGICLRKYKCMLESIIKAEVPIDLYVHGEM
jgi:hypothetical protein